MQLLQAMKTALKYVEKTKNLKDPHGYVLLDPVESYDPPRFFTSPEGKEVEIFKKPMYVLAQNEDFGVKIEVDIKDSIGVISQPIALHWEIFTPAIQAANTTHAITFQPFGMNKAYMEYTSKWGEPTKATLYSMNVHSLPKDPTLGISKGEFVFIESANLLTRVAHACAKNHSRKELTHVHLSSRGVEATDQFRTAFSPVVLTEGNYMIPSKILQNWPKKITTGVGVLIKEPYIYIYVQGELRFCRTIPAEFDYNFESIIPSKQRGNKVELPLSTFKKYVKNTVKCSPSKNIDLRFGDNLVSINALGSSPQEIIYTQNIIADEATSFCSVLINGKLLIDCLDSLDEKVISISYRTSTDPIIIEASGYVESIWPLLIGDQNGR